MKIKLILLAFLLLLIFPIMVFAQVEDIPFDVDKALIAAILGAFGLGVLGITELIKTWLKVANWHPTARKVAGYVISLVVTLGATTSTLIATSRFTWGSFILYSLIVWAEANGIFKAIRNIIKKYR